MHVKLTYVTKWLYISGCCFVACIPSHIWIIVICKKACSRRRKKKNGNLMRELCVKKLFSISSSFFLTLSYTIHVFFAKIVSFEIWYGKWKIRTTKENYTARISLLEMGLCNTMCLYIYREEHYVEIGTTLYGNVIFKRVCTI